MTPKAGRRAASGLLTRPAGRRLLLTLAGSLGPVVLALVWFEVQRSEAGAPAADEAQPAPPSIVFADHVERIRDRRGRVMWQIEAQRAALLGTGDYVVDGLTHAQFFSDGLATVHLTAARAQYETRGGQGGNLWAGGGVVLTSRLGVEAQLGSLYWFEAEARMVAPDVESIRWRDPNDPKSPPLVVVTPRLFFWPRENRLLLPETIAGRRGADTFKAAAGSASLADGRLRLAGPAAVDAFVAAPGDRGASLRKRIQLSVERGGEMAYNSRGGGALLAGEATLRIPADRLTVRCDKAVYQAVEASVRLTGRLSLDSPRGSASAPSAVVDTRGRRATLSGPVELRPAEMEAGSNITAGALVYHYEPSRERAEASGGVTIDLGATSARAPRADIDLVGQTALLSGGVTLRHVAQRPGAEPEPITVTSRRLRHQFAIGARRSAIDDGLTFTLRRAKGSADRMSFDHELELLTLEGQVRLRTAEGDSARCARLIYDVRADTLTIDSPAEAAVYFEID